MRSPSFRSRRLKKTDGPCGRVDVPDDDRGTLLARRRVVLVPACQVMVLQRRNLDGASELRPSCITGALTLIAGTLMLTGTDLASVSGLAAAAEDAAGGLDGGKVPTDGGMTLTLDLGVLHPAASIRQPAATRAAASPGSCQRRRGLSCSPLPLSWSAYGDARRGRRAPRPPGRSESRPSPAPR